MPSYFFTTLSLIIIVLKNKFTFLNKFFIFFLDINTLFIALVIITLLIALAIK